MDNQNALMLSDRQLADSRDVAALRAVMLRLRDEIFVAGIDYGLVPGAKKQSLYLPGMEKIMRQMRLRPEYARQPDSVIDFEKPLFFLSYECRIVEVETGLVVYTAIGSCNSRETKYRYRNAGKVCPACQRETIIKGRTEYGGGWICLTKKGGCGAKFDDGDRRITDQATGQTENVDVADQLDTIQKMAQKRALASAVKGVANVSEFFDVEIETAGQPAEPARPPERRTEPRQDTLGNPAIWTTFCKNLKALGGNPAEAVKTLNAAGYSRESLTLEAAMEIIFPADVKPIEGEIIDEPPRAIEPASESDGDGIPF